MAKNRFSGLRQAIKQQDTEASPNQEGTESQGRVTEKPKRPRLKWGKSSNPDYRQVTAYVQADTYEQVQRVLAKRARGNFSDLIQQLLVEWLKSQY